MILKVFQVFLENFAFLRIKLKPKQNSSPFVDIWNTNITSLSRWKCKWSLLPESTDEPRGLNAHALKPRVGFTEGFYLYRRDPIYTNRQTTNVFSEFFKMWITWVRCVVSSIWTHNISLDCINIVSKSFYDLHGERNVYRSRQGVSPGKAPYKKKTLIYHVHFGRPWFSTYQ